MSRSRAFIRREKRDTEFHEEQRVDRPSPLKPRLALQNVVETRSRVAQQTALSARRANCAATCTKPRETYLGTVGSRPSPKSINGASRLKLTHLI